MDLGALTTISEDIFDFEINVLREIPYANNWIKSITYEVSLDKIIYGRTNYSFLDFLRDLGGLATSLHAMGMAFVLLMQYRGPILFVMTELFATPKQRAASMQSVKEKSCKAYK